MNFHHTFLDSLEIHEAWKARTVGRFHHQSQERECTAKPAVVLLQPGKDLLAPGFYLQETIVQHPEKELFFCLKAGA